MSRTKPTKWAASWQNQQNDLRSQQRLRSAWTSIQSDQSLRCPHEETLGPQLHIEHTVKTLIRLPSWSESSLGAQIILLVLSWGGSNYMCSVKTQISLGICLVWSESLLALSGKLRNQTFLWQIAKTQIRLGRCLDWFKSCWVHRSFCFFVVHLPRRFLTTVRTELSVSVNQTIAKP